MQDEDTIDLMVKQEEIIDLEFQPPDNWPEEFKALYWDRMKSGEISPSAKRAMLDKTLPIVLGTQDEWVFDHRWAEITAIPQLVIDIRDTWRQVAAVRGWPKSKFNLYIKRNYEVTKQKEKSESRIEKEKVERIKKEKNERERPEENEKRSESEFETRAQREIHKLRNEKAQLYHENEWLKSRIQLLESAKEKEKKEFEEKLDRKSWENLETERRWSRVVELTLGSVGNRGWSGQEEARMSTSRALLPERRAHVLMREYDEREEEKKSTPRTTQPVRGPTEMQTHGESSRREEGQVATSRALPPENQHKEKTTGKQKREKSNDELKIKLIKKSGTNGWEKPKDQGWQEMEMQGPEPKKRSVEMHTNDASTSRSKIPEEKKKERKKKKEDNDRRIVVK